MSKILVTGGAGFIGSHLVEHLLSLSHQVSVLDDLSSGALQNLEAVKQHPDFKFVQGSILDAQLVTELVAQNDKVFHLAAAVGVGLIASQPQASVDTNIQGTRNVLAACAERSCAVLFVSSSEVYGHAAQEALCEDANLLVGAGNGVRWSYACSKLMGEILTRVYQQSHSLPAVVVRLFNTTGPRQSSRYGMVMARFSKQAFSGEPITVYGSGQQTRCFCHVADIVPALALLLDNKQAYGQVINLGASSSISIMALAEKVKSLSQSLSPIVQVPFETVYGDSFEDIVHRRPDTTKARRLIGFNPQKSLEQIIEDTLKHLKKTAPAVCSEND